MRAPVSRGRIQSSEAASKSSWMSWQAGWLRVILCPRALAPHRRFPGTDRNLARKRGPLSVKYILLVAESEQEDPSQRRPKDLRSEEHTSELQSPCNLVCSL